MDILPTLARQLESLQQTHNIRLTPGEKLDVLVRGMRSSTEVSLFMRGQEINARTETPLQPGRYQVLVQSIHPALSLKILPQTISHLGSLPHLSTVPSALTNNPLTPVLQFPSVLDTKPLLLPGTTQPLPEENSLLRQSRFSVEDLLRNLQATTPNKGGSAGSKPAASQLQHLVHYGGMLMEQHLLAGNRLVVQDLKFQLLMLASRYANSDRLMDTIRQRLQFLTKEQIANIILNQDGIFLVEIPLDITEQLRRLRMRLQKRKKDAQGIDSDILSLYMEFSHLGEIKVNCFRRAAGVEIVIFSNDRSTVALLEKNLESLKHSAEELIQMPVSSHVRYREENLFREFDENLVLIQAMKSWQDDESDES